MVNNFALVPYASAIETLRMANQVAGQALYTWETLSMDGKSVNARCGLKISPDRAISEPADYAAFIVSGGTNIKQNWSIELGEQLKNIALNKTMLGALSTGPYLLAKAGVLDGYRCTAHWQVLAAMQEDFPRLILTDCIYEIDRNRCTCAGGTTAIDMMLHLISLEHGQKLSTELSENLLLDRTRSMHDRQCIPLRHEVGTSQPKLTEAASLMANNIEEPLNSDELASLINTSRRHLERLFSTYLGCSPMNYYLGLRLKNAQRLLKQTEKSILEISIACGFTSATYFSKCYRNKFGVTPKSDRSVLSFWDNGLESQSDGSQR